MQCNKLTSGNHVHFDTQKYQTIPSDSAVRAEIVCPYPTSKRRTEPGLLPDSAPFIKQPYYCITPTANGVQQA